MGGSSSSSGRWVSSGVRGKVEDSSGLGRQW